MRKTLTFVALCSMVAVLTQGADIRYRQSGDWTETAPLDNQPGWQSVSSVPGVDDMGIINWGGNTVTLTTTETIGALRVGQDEVGNLLVTSTGTLTTDASGAKDGRLTLGQGNNPAGTGAMTIQAGGTVNVGDILFNGLVADGTADVSGTLNVGNHLWTGWNTGATGTYNINDGGVLNVSGQLGLNWQNNGAVGIINVNDGGTVNLAQIHADGISINGSSLLTIAEGGLLTKTGNFTSVIQTNYIDVGKIVGEGGAPLSVTYDANDDLTSVVVIPEPATLSLMAVFGAVIFFRRRIAR